MSDSPDNDNEYEYEYVDYDYDDYDYDYDYYYDDDGIETETECYVCGEVFLDYRCELCGYHGVHPDCPGKGTA